MNQAWTADFIHDSVLSTCRFRAFMVLDHWSRESLVIEIDLPLTGDASPRSWRGCAPRVDYH
jgi:hypothetical protein